MIQELIWMLHISFPIYATFTHLLPPLGTFGYLRILTGWTELDGLVPLNDLSVLENTRFPFPRSQVSSVDLERE